MLFKQIIRFFWGFFNAIALPTSAVSISTKGSQDDEAIIVGRPWQLKLFRAAAAVIVSNVYLPATSLPPSSPSSILSFRCSRFLSYSGVWPGPGMSGGVLAVHVAGGLHM